ncbi:LPXTG cell wall anchor domain-containing protein [Clostridium sp. Marseille-P3244]|nr:LPXTG cell wall anchor domain-containing protein [Clostridium sp. Marseille-P3244]
MGSRENGATPQTGDTLKLGLYVLILFMSGFIAIASAILKRKEKKG